MNIIKILAVSAIFLPSVVLAQTLSPVAGSTDTTSTTSVSETSASVKKTDAGDSDSENSPEDMGVSSDKRDATTSVDHEDDGAIEGDDNQSEVEVEDTHEVDSEDVGETEDSKDAEDSMESFSDVFMDMTDDNTRAAMDAFMELSDVNGEDHDSAQGSDVAPGNGDIVASSPADGSELRDLIVVGSEVRAKAQAGSVEVRGWDPVKKEVTINPNDVEDGEDLLNFVGAITLSDENIKSVSLNPEKITMEYDQPARLFGFIPMSLTAQAELDKNDVIKVRFPWYTFLTKSSKSEISAQIQSAIENASKNEADANSLAQRARRFQTISDAMRAGYDAMMASIQNAK